MSQPSQYPSYKYCGRMGHEEYNCFEIIEYPARWVLQGGGRGYGKGCEARGYGETGTQGRGQGTTYASQVAIDDQTAAKIENAEFLPIVLELSAEQVQHFLRLNDPPKITCDKLLGNGDWLLDSGAS